MKLDCLGMPCHLQCKILFIWHQGAPQRNLNHSWKVQPCHFPSVFPVVHIMGLCLPQYIVYFHAFAHAGLSSWNTAFPSSHIAFFIIRFYIRTEHFSQTQCSQDCSYWEFLRYAWALVILCLQFKPKRRQDNAFCLFQSPASSIHQLLNKCFIIVVVKPKSL